MKCKYMMLFTVTAMSITANTALAGQFVVELDKPLQPLTSEAFAGQDVRLTRSFSAGEDSYAVFSAPDESSLNDFLKSAAIEPDNIAEVLFVNSPAIGGGEPAGVEPRDGHEVFVIERPIPGVGFFGLDKKKKISMGSNNAIQKLGTSIEWDLSYLTKDGTYCVYRADSPQTLREHGALAGAPIGKITPVDQKNHQ